MYFLIEGEKLWEKNNVIWNYVSNSKEEKIDSKSIYNLK